MLTEVSENTPQPMLQKPPTEGIHMNCKDPPPTDHLNQWITGPQLIPTLCFKLKDIAVSFLAALLIQYLQGIA